MNPNNSYYKQLINLYFSNEFLAKKEEKIIYLLENCSNQEEERLIFELLERFKFLDDRNHNLLLNSIIEYIKSLNLDYSKTQFIAMTVDSSPDSGQSVLYSLRNKIYEQLTESPKLSNNFNKVVSFFNQGYTNIIVIDELIGSGKTVRARLKTFIDRKTCNKHFNMHFVFLLGIEHFVEELKKENYNIFCAFELKRGISDYYLEEERTKKIGLMLNIENRLSPQINDKLLKDYSLGYGRAEALYSGESHGYNTPNSVFPIFWWKTDFEKNKRNTLLTRYEDGF